MNIRLLLCCILLFLGAVSAMCAPASAACPRYEVASYIVLPGCSWVGMNAIAINVHGHACGSASCGIGDGHAWVWYGDEFITIPMPSGAFRSESMDINDDGIVVGWVQIQELGVSTYAFRFDGTTTELLPTLKEGNTSRASSINNHGVIVGDSTTAQGISAAHPVRWINGEIEDLADPGDFQGFAKLIDDAGDIAMLIDSEPVILQERTRTALPVPSNTVSVRFSEVSETGVVAARIGLYGGAAIAVTWSKDKLSILPVPAGLTRYYPRGISPSGGTVVGLFEDASYGGPILWIDRIAFLARPLVQSPADDFWLSTIEGVNTAGQILASGGFFSEDVAKGLILQPIAPVAGDTTCNGVVDFRDIIRVLSTWGSCDGCTGDLDENGNVGPEDLLIVLDQWGF